MVNRDASVEALPVSEVDGERVDEHVTMGFAFIGAEDKPRGRTWAVGPGRSARIAVKVIANC
jgi:hypothetical protein